MYAVLDIETTGGKYDEEGITEIAIYKHDGKKVIDQFSSLVNPQIPIQPFVQKLTGISTKMLLNAPKFYEVAKRIVEITEDCVLVAHNASFDYRILQTEFRRLGFAFERKSLCTVELSKALLPDLPAYNLGKLVRHLGIPFADQHRAHGDAKATVKLFELLIEKDIKKSILKTHISEAHPNKVAPKFLDIVDGLPTEMGVYYIHNMHNQIIYIGKSNNIKKRILSHLTSNSKKGQTIQNEISSVSYELVSSELITLLKEQNEIKIIRPKLNKAMIRRTFPMGIRVEETEDYPKLILEQVRKEHHYLSVYKNQKAAKAALHYWCENYGICLQKTSLSQAKGACFYYGIEKCQGPCVGLESVNEYKEKINALVATLSYPHQDFLIVLDGRKTGESSFVYLKDNCFQGYGYYELNHQIKTSKRIESRLVQMEDNPDTQKLIRSFLARKKYNKLIPL